MSPHLAASLLCFAAAVATFLVLEVARHVQYRRHRGSGFVPGTQHWCMIASGIALLFSLLSIIFLVLHARQTA